MSNTVDERVVSMQFDNRQFENNVQTSLSTIEKLKQSLKLTDAAKGFENVNTAANKVNLSGLSGAVETIQVKFSALQTIAMTALSNITNSAINAGKKIVSALTIDPVKSGFQEYETQINAVQTILANTSSKGTTIDDVNKALDELNRYADKTIYNFTEMTRNIGTFTAAGIDLETSTSAIQGIANLAAVSGSTSQQASTAMYQLSQALSSGTVKLQDWNSVVNAGMGGQVFQDALKQTARVHGIEIDKMIEKEGSFRETLKNGWLTSDVLTETLQQFTMAAEEGSREWKKFKKTLMMQGYTEKQAEEILKMANTATDAATKVKTFTQLIDTLKESLQSGWTQTWEIVIGDFEEAKALLTEVSDTLGGYINASAEARNEMLQGWKDMGGRDKLIEALKNAFEGLVNIIGPLKEAFSKIFPPITSKQLMTFTENFNKLMTAFKESTSKFKVTDDVINKLKSTFGGIFSVLDMTYQGVKALVGGIVDFIVYLAPVGDGLLDIASKCGNFLMTMNESIKSTDLFEKVVSGFFGIIKTVGSGISSAFNLAKGAIESFFDVIKDKLNLSDDFSIFGTISETANNAAAKISNLSQLINTLKESLQAKISNTNVFATIQSIWNWLIEKSGDLIASVKVFTNFISDKLGNANFDGILNFINTLSFGGLVMGMKNFGKNISKPFEDLSGTLNGFKGILNAIKGNFTAFTGVLDSVRGCFEEYQNKLKADTLITIASAIGILAASIIALSFIDSEQLTVAIGAISGLFAELLLSMKIFSKITDSLGETKRMCSAMIAMSVSIAILSGAMINLSSLDWEGVGKGLVGIAGLATIITVASKKMEKMKGGMGLVIFAAAIKILGSVMNDLSSLSWEGIAKGLAGVGGLFAEIDIFLNTAKFGGKSVSTATGILILSAAIKVLASACKDFVVMSWEEIGKGLSGVGGLLLELVGFTRLVGSPKNIIGIGTGLVLIGASMKIFASSMSDFASMSWEEIGKGLLAMAGALLEVTLAINFMPKNMIGVGAGLVVVGAALKIMASAMSDFGSMSWEEIGKGLTVLGGALLELTLALNFMKGSLAGSAALIIAAGALAILTPILITLGGMSWESIVKGLVAIAGAFAVFGIAGAVLAPIIPSILALAGSFALFGAGILAIGVGLVAAGAGITAIVLALASLAPAATAIVAALSMIIVGVADLIPVVCYKIGEGIIAICEVLIASAPLLCEAVVVLLDAIMTGIAKATPVLLKGLAEVVMAFLELLAEYTEPAIKAILDILIGLFKALAERISPLIQVIIDIVVQLIDGLIKATPKLVQAAVDFILAFINGLADAIDKNTPLVVEAINRLMISILNAALTVLAGGVDLIFQAGKTIMNSGLVKGMMSMWDGVKKSVSNLITNAKKAITDKIEEWKNAGKNLIEGFTKGIKDKASDVIESAKGVVSDALEGAKKLLGIHSPSKAFEMIGKYADEGLIVGLDKNAPGVIGSTLALADDMMLTFSAAIDAQKKPTENKLKTTFAGFSKTVKESFSGGLSTFKDQDLSTFTSWMDNLKYYDKLSLADELTGWQAMQDKYEEGTEEREKADREVYRIQNEIRTKEYEDACNQIDELKSYNKLSLIAELAAWKKMQKKYAEGTDERKKADKEVYNLQKEINKANEDYYKEVEEIHKETNEKKIELDKEYLDKTKEINDKLEEDIKDVNDAYEDSVKSRTDTLRNAYSLFDEVEKKEAADGSTLIKNLQSQVDAFADWQTNINGLASRGVSSVLLDELREMGPSAAAEIAGLNNMSSDELNTYVSLWQQKYELAKGQAIYELQDLRSESDDEIAKLRADAAKELSEFKGDIDEEMAETVSNSETKLAELRKSWKENLGLMREETESEFTTMSENIINTLGEGSKWSDVGVNMIEGLLKGVVDNASSLTEGITAVMNDALNAAKQTLGIHSPSRAFQEIGMYVDKGFALGLNDFSYVASSAASNVGEESISAMSKVISKISSIINGDIDVNPAIRPVVDLTDFNRSTRLMRNSFGDIGQLSLNSAMNTAGKISSGMNSNYNSDGATSTGQNGATFSFTQNNYSPKALNRIDIYRQTNNQFSALKGMI